MHYKRTKDDEFTVRMHITGTVPEALALIERASRVEVPGHQLVSSYLVRDEGRGRRLRITLRFRSAGTSSMTDEQARKLFGPLEARRAA